MAIAWMLFGAFIGTLAAHRRGFGAATGIFAGILLGPLSILMFFASSDRMKCPQCAEWIKEAANICPYCKSQLPDKKNAAKGIGFIGLFLIIIFGYTFGYAIFTKINDTTSKSNDNLDSSYKEDVSIGDIEIKDEGLDSSNDHWFSYSVMVHNKTNEIKNVYLVYDAVDSSGVKVDSIMPSGTIPPNSTKALADRYFLSKEKFDRVAKWILKK